MRGISAATGREAAPDASKKGRLFAVVDLSSKRGEKPGGGGGGFISAILRDVDAVSGLIHRPYGSLEVVGANWSPTLLSQF